MEVRGGIKAGESVVVSANFLIDAESNLKAALGTFGSTPKSEATPSPATPTPPAAGSSAALKSAADANKGH